MPRATANGQGEGQRQDDDRHAGSQRAWVLTLVPLVQHSGSIRQPGLRGECALQGGSRARSAERAETPPG
eukprot:4608603-Alexandrium_andersonii.AAC.1